MHRNLPRWCFQTDGDWFEQRRTNGELHTVAYIETIQMPSDEKTFEDYPVWSSKKSLCLEIETKMRIPAYIVWHSPNCLIFFVQRITRDKPIKMTEKEYIAFIEGLNVRRE